MKHPDGYRQWRKLWRSLAAELGWHVSFNIQQGKPLMDRTTWRLHCQMYRVHLQLMAETEAVTDDWCKAMWECLSNGGMK